jgi:hypothetical protein
MSRFITLCIAVALMLLPGSALAETIHDVGGPHPGQHVAMLDANGIDQEAAHRRAVAVGQYYASYRDRQSLPQPAQSAPAAEADGGVPPSLAIGLGIALMLLAGGLGVYAGRTIRPRHLGA